MEYTRENVEALLHKKKQEDYPKYVNYTADDLLIELINNGVITDICEVNWEWFQNELFIEVGEPYHDDNGWWDAQDLSFTPNMGNYIRRINDIETRIRLLEYWQVNAGKKILTYSGYRHNLPAFKDECDRLIYENKQLLNAKTEPQTFNNEKPMEANPKEESTIIPHIPHAELLSEDGWILMRKVQKAGLLDENFMPVKGILSHPKAAIVASEIAKRIGLDTQWAVFQKIWNHSSRMAQEYGGLTHAKYADDFTKYIKSILDN